MKVKVKLEVWDRTVIYQVLEMDERFRSGEGCKRNVYKCNNGLSIVSSSTPYIDSRTVYLRGEDSNDDSDVETLTFDTAERAREYFWDVLEALAEWSENWPGFRDPEPVVGLSADCIYSF